MSPHHILALALLVVGSAALLLSAAALLAMPDTFGKLHALTPASTLGAPAIALAVALEEGIGRGTVKFLFIAAITAAGGTVAAMATGRVLAAATAKGASGADSTDRVKDANYANYMNHANYANDAGRAGSVAEPGTPDPAGSTP